MYIIIIIYQLGSLNKIVLADSIIDGINFYDPAAFWTTVLSIMDTKEAMVKAMKLPMRASIGNLW